MEDLILLALNDAFTTLENLNIPPNKIIKSVSISSVKPTELKSFIKTNKIPNDAYFDSGQDGNDIYLSFETTLPANKKRKLEYKIYTFHDIAFRKVYKLLTENGYKRVICEPGFYDQCKNTNRITYKSRNYAITSIVLFDNKSIYHWYMKKNLKKLIEYYFIYFEKE